MLFKAICRCLILFLWVAKPADALLTSFTGTRSMLKPFKGLDGSASRSIPKSRIRWNNPAPLYAASSRGPDQVAFVEDPALFKLEEQKVNDWLTFSVAVGGVLGAMYYVWLYPGGPNLGNMFVDSVETFAGGNSALAMCGIYAVFAAVHSGLAGIRPFAEPFLGARVWRYIFALASLPLALTCIVYFMGHRYDGNVLWDIRALPGIHSAVWWTSLLSFFFLYPSTFNLLEVAAVKKPALHLWEGGIARITRHPQMVGQLLWCLAHTAYVGTSFMCVTSALLCAHHVFGVWHGDSRLRDKFGAAAAAYQARTSIVPFAAILDGRQQLPADYYKEFLRLPYLTVAVGSVLAYQLHPLMLFVAQSIHW